MVSVSLLLIAIGIHSDHHALTSIWITIRRSERIEAKIILVRAVPHGSSESKEKTAACRRFMDREMPLKTHLVLLKSRTVATLRFSRLSSNFSAA